MHADIREQEGVFTRAASIYARGPHELRCLHVEDPPLIRHSLQTGRQIKFTDAYEKTVYTTVKTKFKNILPEGNDVITKIVDFVPFLPT